MLPARSGRENSGAFNGSIIHVSTWEGSGSNFGSGPACAHAGFGAARAWPHLLQALHNFDPWSTGIFRTSNKPAWPADGSPDRAFRLAHTKENFFGMLGESPDPACKYFVCRSAPTSIVIAVPMPSRLLLRPCKRTRWRSQAPSSRRAKSLVGGHFVFQITSSRPSRSRSASAKQRLSSAKSNPTAPETSLNVPSRLFANMTFRSKPLHEPSDRIN